MCSREKTGEGDPLFRYRARAIWQNDLLLYSSYSSREPSNDGRFTRAEVGSLINGRRDKRVDFTIDIDGENVG